MKLSELKSGQGKVDVEVKVKSKADIRQFEKYGKPLRVCNAVVEDESGEIAMSLWNDDVDKVNVGDKLKITNGYVSEFNGIKQLTSGKFGKLEVIYGDSAKKEDSKEAVKEKVKKVKDEEPEEVEF
jgi:replication factor A1